MNADSVISVIQESLYLILVFGAFITYAVIRGKQSLINLILGLYFALLISLKFPSYDIVLKGASGDRFSDSVVMIVIFLIFTIAATFFFSRLMPRDYEDSAFSEFPKKFLFALLATILVMAYSYHVLPITEIITPGSPIQTLFGGESYFFWWLLVPMVGLFFL